ncbi:MAG: hypothetical protein KF803_02670 [Cyclobacteriaceae bacterium]|nr:hypothetical protein [Cyclobacteriaceae bacterium]
METNLKIVEFGERLALIVKRVELCGQLLTTEQIQRACSIIGRVYKVAATPYQKNGKQSILIEVHDHIPVSTLTVDDWVIELVFTTDKFPISVAKRNERSLVADLYKRSLLIQIASRTGMWTLDTPRIFYEKTPFIKSDFTNDLSAQVTDIDAYRRYEISELFVDKAGLAFSIGVRTAFITSLSVGEYYSSGLDKRLKKLLGRQTEHKGTLIYQGPTGRKKCYFEGYKGELTLQTAPAFKVKGKTYRNPYEYFRSVYPNFEVKPDDKVALVSFPGMGTKVYVPANKLFIRVMNDMLDSSMSNEDKISANNRMSLVSALWNLLGEKPFGKNYANIQAGFYRPDMSNSGTIALPEIRFGGTNSLPAPVTLTTDGYRSSFRSRKEYLTKFGCYFVNQTMPRKIHFCFPEQSSISIREKFANDLCAKIKELTKIDVTPVIVAYANYMLGIADLKNNHEAGMVVFIFEDVDPATYFNIRFELRNWRVKRVTTRQLGKKYNGLNAYKDGKFEKGLKGWNSFIEINSFDVVQQLGCLPFTIEPNFHNDMQLVIDVSEKSSHIVFSLVMFKAGMKVPIFDSLVKPKTDSKKETINPAYIEKYVTEMFQNHKSVIGKHHMNSLLVLRDGKNCGEEYSALLSTVQKLVQMGVLDSSFKMTFVEYHKTTLKEVRLIERQRNQYVNVLEGTYFIPDEHTAILASTGSGTLNQGTAAPIMLKSGYGDCDLKKVLHDVFVSSQLNFSSPGVAQRLTFAAKRADEQLKDRIAQEVMRLK